MELVIIIMGRKMVTLKMMFLILLVISSGACKSIPDTYHDPNMDFGAIKKVAVMPFENLTTDRQAADRVRDVFITLLLSTRAIYVLPVGEVARGIARTGISNPTAPSTEEILKLAGVIKVDAVITGALREYGEVRSGTSSANKISLSLQMVETQTGKIVWSASSTKGGIKLIDRLFGGGGTPINRITQKAANALINKLFR